MIAGVVTVSRPGRPEPVSDGGQSRRTEDSQQVARGMSFGRGQSSGSGGQERGAGNCLPAEDDEIAVFDFEKRPLYQPFLT